MSVTNTQFKTNPYMTAAEVTEAFDINMTSAMEAYLGSGAAVSYNAYYKRA